MQTQLAPLELEPPMTKGRFFLQLCAALILAGTLVLAASWIKKTYQDGVPARTSTNQENYFKHFKERQPVLWLELGKQGKEQISIIQNPNYQLRLYNFRIGRTWNRQINWSVRSDGNGRFVIRFQDAKPKSIALYMTDGDSHWRAGTIRLGSSVNIFDQLHNGKWIELPLSEAQQASGMVKFRFDKLTGDDIAVSAVAVLE